MLQIKMMQLKESTFLNQSNNKSLKQFSVWQIKKKISLTGKTIFRNIYELLHLLIKNLVLNNFIILTN